MLRPMIKTRQIAALTRRTLAVWSLLLSLLLVWSFGVDQGHAASGPVAPQEAIGLQGTPELAALQIKPSPVQRPADDRFGTGPDASLPIEPSVPDTVLLTSYSLAGWSLNGPPSRNYTPHSPRAPPAA